MTMRLALQHLLDRTERHICDHITGEEKDRLLRDLAPYRRALDWAQEREVLHAVDKLLWHCLAYARGDEHLRAELAPFVEVVLSAHARLGRPCLVRELAHVARGH
jgi:hypothetical protein